jgi:hypothetical protein
VGSPTVPKGTGKFLARHTDAQVVDFWHAAEYLGNATMLSLRCLTYTAERWHQFWSKFDRWGIPVAA